MFFDFGMRKFDPRLPYSIYILLLAWSDVGGVWGLGFGDRPPARGLGFHFGVWGLILGFGVSFGVWGFILGIEVSFWGLGFHFKFLGIITVVSGGLIWGLALIAFMMGSTRNPNLKPHKF